MNIIGTQYTLEYNSLDIYVAGCSGNPHCPNCHNPESWSFNIGETYNQNYFNKIKKKVDEFDVMIKNIMIFGGEPLDQKHTELICFLSQLRSLNKKIWLFTRYDISDIPIQIKNLCNYIKTGGYIEELKCEKNVQYGIKLATKNQKIYKIF